MVRFVNSLCPGTLVRSIVPKVSKLSDESSKQLTVPEDPNVQKVLSNAPLAKTSLGFIANQLQLGDFCMEFEFANQELPIDVILETCEFFGVDILRTFQQAMKSPDEKNWSAAVGTPFGMDWQLCEGEITEDNIPDIYELLQLLRVV
jgi:hypothetical protein